MKRTGAYAHVFYDTFDPERVIKGNGTNTTTAGTWYKIIDTGAGTRLPYDGGIFRAPIGTAMQITLVTGDQLFPIDPNRICKTSCSVSLEEGTVDVGDDCDPGASILDGNVKISGSLAGFFRYNDVTEEFDNVTTDVLNKFVDMIKDSGAGIYEIKERENVSIELMINLNSNAKVGQIEHWLLVPALISSASINLGNTDAQNKDMSWSKGEGKTYIYSTPKAA